MIYTRNGTVIDAKKDLCKCEVDDIAEFENTEDYEYWTSILGIRNDWIKIDKWIYKYRPIIVIKTESYQYCDVCRNEIDYDKDHYQCKYEHDLCEGCFAKANTFEHKKEYLGQVLELLNYYSDLKDDDFDDEFNEFNGPKIPTGIIEKTGLLDTTDHIDLWLLFITRGKEIIEETKKAFISPDEEMVDEVIWSLNYDDEAFCQDGMSPCLCPVCRGEIEERVMQE